MSDLERVVYVGADHFNRPVFRSIDHPRNFFGSTSILVNCEEDERVVLAKVKEGDISFFGNKFGCEPMGTPAKNIKIITKDEHAQ